MGSYIDGKKAGGDHATLDNLDFSTAGHTGFETAGSYTSAITYANLQDDYHTTSANAYATSGAAGAYTSSITYANLQDDYHTTSANAYATSGAAGAYTSAITYANLQDDYHTTSANAYATSGAAGAYTSATAFTTSGLSLKAPIASPTFTGTITIPDAASALRTVTAVANGKTFIGNGTGFTVATLTAGTGVVISNGAGSITISTSGSGGGVTIGEVAAWAALGF
jgi:hypothetical protein